MRRPAPPRPPAGRSPNTGSTETPRMSHRPSSA
jgi:hypothetical protein